MRVILLAAVWMFLFRGLRKIFKNEPLVNIHTIHGIGYKLEVDENPISFIGSPP